MSSEQREEKILKAILKKMDDRGRPILLRPWVVPLMWIFMGVAGYVLASIAPGINQPLFLVLPGFIFGALIGVIGVLVSSEHVWSFLMRHIDRESVEGRLAEVHNKAKQAGTH